jgi:hypothetical protein
VTDDGKTIPPFTQYLNTHPEAAETIRTSVRRTLDQYRLAESAIMSASKQWQETQSQIAKAVRAVQVPTEALKRIEKYLDALYPPNWPRPVPEEDKIKEVLEEDGIPIVHIPRAEIVQAIVDADNYGARIQIIENRADDIADDCTAALDKKHDDWLEKQIPLIRRAIEAYQAGYFEAAQALSVSVCDTYLKKMFHNENNKQRVGYPKMAERLAFDKSEDESVAWVYNVGYALVPAVQFLADWRPEDGDEPPTRLSRHASVHSASTDHMTKLNATIAIMLVTGMSVALTYPMRLMGQN